MGAPSDQVGGSSASYKEIVSIYEDGKHRRYELLFAVNGGAFAVASIFSGKGQDFALGKLSLQEISFGLAAFSIVMCWDMYQFGYRMRAWSGDNNKVSTEGIFNRSGKIVLLFICILLTVGFWSAYNLTIY